MTKTTERTDTNLDANGRATTVTARRRKTTAVASKSQFTLGDRMTIEALNRMPDPTPEEVNGILEMLVAQDSPHAGQLLKVLVGAGVFAS